MRPLPFKTRVALTAGRRGADRAGTEIRYPTKFSRLILSASEPIFAFGPASYHRPRGPWGHPTQQKRRAKHPHLYCI